MRTICTESQSLSLAPLREIPYGFICLFSPLARTVIVRPFVAWSSVSSVWAIIDGWRRTASITPHMNPMVDVRAAADATSGPGS